MEGMAVKAAESGCKWKIARQIESFPPPESGASA